MNHHEIPGRHRPTHDHPGRRFGRHFGSGDSDHGGGGRGGRGFGGGRGPGGPRGRMRRGDIRTALLTVLAEGPGHGYDIMRRLEDKSAGAWRPSAGSVYPTLQQLEDEGLATSSEAEGKRVYTITHAGAAEAQRRVAEGGGEPWTHGPGSGVHPGLLFRSVGALGLAGKQVVVAGTPAQLARAIEIVDDARQQIYRLLADGAGDAPAEGDDDESVDTNPID